MPNADEFEFKVRSLTGRDVAMADRFIADGGGSGIWDYVSPQGKAIGAELREHLFKLRMQAFHAFMMGNMPVMEKAVEALFSNAEKMGAMWVNLPKASRATKQGSTKGRK